MYMLQKGLENREERYTTRTWYSCFCNEKVGGLGEALELFAARHQRKDEGLHCSPEKKPGAPSVT
jgi:hypothetical protein